MLGLGSNLGDRMNNLTASLDALDHCPECTVEAVSAIYETTPVDADGGCFLNAAARISTTLSPSELLTLLKGIEARLGRTGSGRDARQIDLDILFFQGIVLKSQDLTIPHPRWRHRQFVLIPLAGICDSFADPDSGNLLCQRIAELAEPSGDVTLKLAAGWWKHPPPNK